ncbi:MAG: hypothetical protein D6805_04645 [Planctomycetota bacterium]|nr:MAG: hypothetical protein D6805_04645 [Planctomycetota bacterium]
MAKKHFITVFADATNRRKMPKEVYRKYKIYGIPAMLFVNSKGKILARMRARDEKSLLSTMQEALRAHRSSQKDKKK